MISRLAPGDLECQPDDVPRGVIGRRKVTLLLTTTDEMRVMGNLSGKVEQQKEAISKHGGSRNKKLR